MERAKAIPAAGGGAVASARNRGRARRVLIYRLGSLGDTVVALPALRVIERAFPDAERRMLTNIPVHAKAPAAAAILDGSGLVQGYIDYPIGTRSARELARVWWKVRSFAPDVLVYLARPRGEEVVRRDARFFRLCGARRIAGLPLGDLADAHIDEATGLSEREASRLLRCVSELGAADVNDLELWNLRLTVGEEQKAREVLAAMQGRPVIACGPGTKMQSKDWGQDNWRALLERLTQKWPDHGLALVGAREDAAVSEFAAAGWRGPVVNLCGELTPRETAAVLQHAVLFMGPDSGPMHLAAAYGVPCAIAFAALDRPGRWFPIGAGNRPIYHAVECAGCLLSVCIEQQKKCLLSISVEEMAAAAVGAMESRKSVYQS